GSGIHTQRVLLLPIVGADDHSVTVQVAQRQTIVVLISSPRKAQVVLLNRTVFERNIKPIVGRIGVRICFYPFCIFLNIFFCIFGLGFASVQYGLVFQVHISNRVPDGIRKEGGLLQPKVVVVVHLRLIRTLLGGDENDPVGSP